MYAQAADNDLAGFGELAGAQEATEKTEISVNSCATAGGIPVLIR